MTKAGQAHEEGDACEASPRAHLATSSFPKVRRVKSRANRVLLRAALGTSSVVIAMLAPTPTPSPHQRARALSAATTSTSRARRARRSAKPEGLRLLKDHRAARPPTPVSSSETEARPRRSRRGALLGRSRPRARRPAKRVRAARSARRATPRARRALLALLVKLDRPVALSANAVRAVSCREPSSGRVTPTAQLILKPARDSRLSPRSPPTARPCPGHCRGGPAPQTWATRPRGREAEHRYDVLLFQGRTFCLPAL